MDNQLPGIGGASKRIEITEDDLTPASKTPAPMPRSAQESAPPRPQALAPPWSEVSAASAEAAASPAVAPLSPMSAIVPAGAKQSAMGTYCSGCGSAIHPRAVVCPHCGVPTTSGVHASGAAMNVALNAKSTGLAILLSLVFTGAGHWYVGRVGRGCAFLAAALVSGMLVLAVVGLILLPIVWVWAAVDANKCAVLHNQRLLEQSRMLMPPSPGNG
jgi:TM2 domain-containing membrane protein YozV